MHKTLVLATCSALVAACGSKKKEGLEPPPPPPEVTPGSGSAGSGGKTGSAGSGSAAAAPKRTIVQDAGFATPESVLYDADSDSYLVANINGTPFATDDNGFISRLGPEGKVLELKWIDGAKPDVKLDAPKGMAISGGVLWVADITVMRKFDPKTGKPLGEVKVPGAVFLNDVVGDGKDGVFVTDTALDTKFQSTAADAIYQVDKTGKVSTYRKDKSLGGPNGLAIAGDDVAVVTFASGELMLVPAKGDIAHRTRLPKGQLDGVIALGGDGYLISSWEGKTVFKGTFTADKASWEDLKLDIESPADIGYDTKRKRILVPHFQGNAVTFIDL